MELELFALRGALAGQHRARVEAELELSSALVTLEGARGELAANTIQLKDQEDEMSRLLEEKEAALEKYQKAFTEQEKQLLAENDFTFYKLTPTVLRSQEAAAVGLGSIRSLIG